MIGGLQKKITDLERYNAIMRERLGQTNGKPDMGVFNSPLVVLKKKEETQ
jgi:hypothetical protein